MTEEIYDPTADVASATDLNPTEGTPFSKARFGEFRIISMRGNFKAQTQTTLAGLTYKEGGEEKAFVLKGFLPRKEGDPAVGIFQRVTRTQGEKAGDQFIVSKLVMTSNDAYHKVVHPGLLETFGDLSRVPMNVWFWAQGEEIPHGKPGKGRETPNTYIKLVKTFKSEAEMREAEKAFFEALGLNQDGNGGSANPYEAAGVTVPSAWVGSEDTFWSYMPSVVAALGAVTVTSTVPPAKFDADPGIKKLVAELAYTPDEARALFAIREAVLAVSPV